MEPIDQHLFSPQQIRVGNQRLLKLADKLDTVPRKRFNFSSWVGNSWKGASDLSCGTTACALGWATTIPSFRKLGLYLDAGGFPRIGELGPVGTYAAQSLFFITKNDAQRLFTPDHWDRNHDETPTPKSIAKEIRKLVKLRGAL